MGLERSIVPGDVLRRIANRSYHTGTPAPGTWIDSRPKENLMSKPMLRISGKFSCGLALALLIPVSGAHAKRSETVLYSFTGQADGGNPFAGLIEDKSGNFYGTTVEGGPDGDGTVFELAPNGTET